MKMTIGHYEEMAKMIVEAFDGSRLEVSDFVAGGRSLGLSEKRVRWDMFWSTDNTKRYVWSNEVYKYLNDDNIDNALKNFVKGLK